ncbi:MULTISPECIES: DUF58 domain-containing protein [unclassified Paenibacillus]|uniref:DUF58 domain-containing protein n=1 Tax=unclassified Paenibacillus TaxID=185978 RepID=UPI000956224B|nr:MULTISPECIES: DUF58 domain-containing protein [unclassified Paenibacillus]ASS68632.1 DUF58 domain-containing protein [Paenibacillus sp. RUD330]SIR65037.1 Uncharacterized conserved protein, DUF58 family, contains vWF domain [Paenibacillus sp. RU4X]SIR72983.1 Uncharacterized conserved protein, DUF58 family, contains vWF domain [Paenibacillus sp. RU4T]
MKASSGRRWPLSRFLARRLRRFILPTRRMVWLAAAGAALPAAAAAAGASPWPPFILWWGLLAAAGTCDLLLLPRRGDWSVKRQLPESAEIRKEFEAVLDIRCRSKQAVRVRLADDLPLVFRSEPAFPEARIQGGGRIHARLAASERGRYRLGSIDLRWSGGLGLWERQTQLSEESEIRIDPDLSGVRDVLNSAQDSLLIDGQRIYKRQRGGTEFDSIREYAFGDDIREVNWRATARAGKLLTNLYRPEKGKTVAILLDCGRQMGVELDNQVKLDRTLEAALAVAAAALKQDDQVALIAYSSRVKLYLPPGRGLAHLQAMTRAVSDLRSDYEESGAGVGLGYLLHRLRRRSFAVLFSDMDHYRHDPELLPYAARTKRSHHLLLLSIRNPVLHELEKARPEDVQGAYVQSIAAKENGERQLLSRKLAGGGIPLVDAPADRLAVTAINAYLESRERGAF